MPTYEYLCDNCGEKFEKFQMISAAPLKKCPHCNKLKLRRLLGAGAGVIFRGSGFYETDYRSESYKKAQASEKTTASEKPATQEKSGTTAAEKKSAPKKPTGTDKAKAS